MKSIGFKASRKSRSTLNVKAKFLNQNCDFEGGEKGKPTNTQTDNRKHCSGGWEGEREGGRRGRRGSVAE